MSSPSRTRSRSATPGRSLRPLARSRRFRPRQAEEQGPDFYDDERGPGIYYPEAEAAIKEATGADRVFIFDHTVRRRVPGAEDRRDGLRQPVARVHVDHTEKSGPQRVRDLDPRRCPEACCKGRVQIINLWRPIRGPLLDSPLAVCDREERIGHRISSPRISSIRERTGETYQVHL